MDVTVPIKELKNTLTVAKRVARKNSPIPSMSGVRLVAEGDTLVVQATDLDTTFTSTLAADVREQGETIVSAAMLADVVKGKGTVALTTAEDGILKAVNGTTSALRTLPLDEWPKAIDYSTAHRYPIDLATVAEVAAAASKDDARPILAGVLFRGNEIVATDSYRLHLATVDVDYPEVLIPAKAVLMAAKAGPVGVLEVATLTSVHRVERDNGKPKYLRDGRPSIYSFAPSVPNPEFKSWTELVPDAATTARIVVGSQSFGMRLIGGEFPNYRQLIPSGYPTSVAADRAAFIHVLEGVKPLAREATPVRLTVADDVLTLTARTHDVGDSTGALPCSLVGDFRPVAFNPEFLLSALTTLRGNTVTLSLVDGLKPAMLQEDRAGGSALRLLMPVRCS